MYIPIEWIYGYLIISLLVFIVSMFIMKLTEPDDYEAVVFFSFIFGSNWFLSGIAILIVLLLLMIKENFYKKS